MPWLMQNRHYELVWSAVVSLFWFICFGVIHSTLIKSTCWAHSAARQLCSSLAIMFYCCHLDLSLFFFPCLISEVAWPIVTKLCYMFDGDPDLRNSVRNFGDPFPSKFGGPKTKFWRYFAQLRDLIANISGMQQDIVNRKTALQTMDTHAQANLMWCTLVHKRRKIGPMFWLTQRPQFKGLALRTQ